MKQPLRQIRQFGFTLIELMVSIVIGLLILLALITLLVNVSRNNSEMSKTNRIIENGRFALQLLQADISHAGYWGGYVPQFDDLSLGTTAVPNDVPTAVPNPCLDYTDWLIAPNTVPSTTSFVSNLIGIAVQSYEIPAVVPSPTLSVCSNRVTSPKANTDVLVVRHVETCVPGEGNCPVYNASNLYFQVARNGTVAPSPAYLLSDDAGMLNLQKRNGSIAELRKFVSSIYYIRNFSVTAGDGIPTLMRSQFDLSGSTLAHKPAEALIEGIEGFRVEFGIDNISDAGINTITGADSAGTIAATNLHSAAIKWAVTTPVNTSPANRGDGSPDGAYIRCTTAVPCTAAQLMNVVAVKLYVLVRSAEQTAGYSDAKTYNLGSTTLGPYNDRFKRHLFTQTIRLTNVSMRRETP
ncbi:MAG: PilW family protein [Candidatus Saccharibacteria bacterium]|nr:PilW family protein [Rhodoferax sp.]